MSTVDPKLFAEAVQAIHAVNNVLWAAQGRINALELVVTQTIEDIARVHDDPKAYAVDFVERARRLAEPLADVNDSTKAERTIEERDKALDEFLITILERAARLKRG
ncbi:MAG: hypothetical protein ACLPKB_02990 [Xanthobacteraceae bacterium]